MKKTMAIVAAMMLATTTFAAEKVRISGKLGELKSDTMYVMTEDADGNDVKEMFMSKNGEFDYSFEPREVTKAYLVFSCERRGKVTNGYIGFTAVPGEHAQVSGTPNEYNITGSHFYQKAAEVDAIDDKFDADSKALSEKIKTLREDKSLSDDEKEKRYNAYLEEYEKKVSAATMDYIRQNANEEATALALRKIWCDDMDKAVKLLSANVANGRMKPICDQAVERAQKKIQLRENAKKVTDGKPAPDFTLMDINGKPFTLSSLRGKYVILDFWGSWCHWCIKGMPDMKKYYAKYPGKFEIVGVDCNDTEVKWKEAVKKNELPWLHVKNEKGEKDISTKYAVKGYPTKIIVDPKGNIDKIIVGEDPEFYTYLDSLFGK
ncbi:MAG: redoxin domain-containing protein [Prevotella sp.]